jgi:hypothetical protein
MEGPHHIFDRPVYVARTRRATGEAARLLDQHVAGDLAERLSVINRTFDTAALITTRPSTSRDILREGGKCLNVMVLPPSSEDTLAACALRPDGLALFAFFAGDTLRELRECWLAVESEITGGASPRVAPMIDLRETGGLLQRAGLALPVADMDTLTLRYDNAIALMQEVKALGFANVMVGRSLRLISRHFLQRVAELYQERFSDPDGRIRATVEIAWAMAWKPHASQQQPLKPGSAKARLADALRVVEQKD